MKLMTHKLQGLLGEDSSKAPGGALAMSEDLFL